MYTKYIRKYVCRQNVCWQDDCWLDILNKNFKNEIFVDKRTFGEKSCNASNLNDNWQQLL